MGDAIPEFTMKRHVLRIPFSSNEYNYDKRWKYFYDATHAMKIGMKY